MTHKTLILGTALLVGTIASVGSAITDRVLADEMKVTNSGDATARFLALGIGKSVMVDLATEIKQVLVGDPSIAKVVVLSKRRLSIIAGALGQTNVYFFDANNRQIGEFEIAVLPTAPEAGDFPANQVTVYHGPLVDQVGVGNLNDNPGGYFTTLNCGPYPFRCLDPNRPGSDQPPGTQNIHITGNGAGAATVPVGVH